jgi:hypothetical protein
VHEIPVAQALVEPFNERSHSQSGCCVSQQRGSITEDAHTTRVDWDRVEKSKATFLPHWTQDGATYAVTFRLADSLPQAALKTYQDERNLLQERLKSQTDAPPEQAAKLRLRLAEIQNSVIDPELDRGYGSCLFNKDAHAKLVANAMAHFEGKRYELLAWCVMPNHVHAVLKLFPGEQLE